VLSSVSSPIMGFAEVTHELRINVAFRNAGLLDVGPGGVLRSWKAFSWSSGGSSAIYVQDANDTRDGHKDACSTQVSARGTENGVLKVYEGAQLKALNGFPDATFRGGVKPGFQIGARLKDPSSRTSRFEGLTDFFRRFRRCAPRSYRGSRVPRALSLGQIDMRDIAPTSRPSSMSHSLQPRDIICS
jgi:hypothetical protein